MYLFPLVVLFKPQKVYSFVMVCGWINKVGKLQWGVGCDIFLYQWTSVGGRNYNFVPLPTIASCPKWLLVLKGSAVPEINFQGTQGQLRGGKCGKTPQPSAAFTDQSMDAAHFLSRETKGLNKKGIKNKIIKFGICQQLWSHEVQILNHSSPPPHIGM